MFGELAFSWADRLWLPVDADEDADAAGRVTAAAVGVGICIEVAIPTEGM